MKKKNKVNRTKKLKKVVINNQEHYAVSMTVGEYISALLTDPKGLASAAGPNFNLSVLSADTLPDHLKKLLQDAGIFDDDTPRDFEDLNRSSES